jgi:hypothetical protein
MPDEREQNGEGINYVKEALNWQYNWIGLAGAAAFAVISGSGLPLVLAAGAELMYLAVVPQSSRFRRLVRSWRYAEEKRLHDENLRKLQGELPPDARARYRDLEKIGEQIRANYARLSSTSQVFVGQLERQLQGLLTSYIRLSSSAIQHRDYVQLTNPESIEREIKQLQDQLLKNPPKVREINERRIDILNRRVEKYQKIRENRQVIEAQCRAIEDVLNLIRDQSITMTDPQEVSARLESLVADVEHTEEAVREVEAIFQMAPAAEDTMFGGSGSTGTRVRN